MTRQIRAGRLADIERLTILLELGKIAIDRYNMNILYGAGSYNLAILRNSLKFSPNIETMENYYYVDAGSESLNKIVNYFEYGTGLFNIKTRKKKPIYPKFKKYMKFQHSKAGKMVFAKEVKGVRPVFMFKKTIDSMNNDRVALQRQIRLKLGL